MRRPRPESGLPFAPRSKMIFLPTAPIATALLATYDDDYVSVGIFLMIVAVVSLISVSFAKERRGADLDA